MPIPKHLPLKTRKIFWLTLVAPPIPEIGDEVKINQARYKVTKAIKSSFHPIETVKGSLKLGRVTKGYRIRCERIGESR